MHCDALTNAWFCTRLPTQEKITSRERRRRERKNFEVLAREKCKMLGKKAPSRQYFHNRSLWLTIEACFCAHPHYSKKVFCEGWTREREKLEVLGHYMCKPSGKNAHRSQYFQNLALWRTHERVFLRAPPNAIRKRFTRAPKARAKKIFALFGHNL